MNFYLSIWSLILLIGCIQSILLSIGALLHKRGHVVSHRILSFLLFIFSIILFDHSLRLSELYKAFPYGLYISDALWYLIAPLIWLYIKTRVENRKLLSSDIWHVIPFLFFAYAYSNMPFMDPSEKMIILEKYQADDFQYSLVIDLFILVMMVQIQVYLWAALFYLKEKIKFFKKEASGNEISQLLVLKNMVKIFAIYFLIEFSISATSIFLGIPNQFIERWSLVVWTMFILLLAYQFIQYPQQIFGHIKRSPSKYDGDKIPDLKRNLLKVMEESKPYLNSDLSLRHLANLIDSNPHQLSYLLNRNMNVSFYNFINSYRIRHVAKQLKAGEQQQLSIFGIAQESGFKSKASFYSFFKKEFGMTPKDYAARIKKDE